MTVSAFSHQSDEWSTPKPLWDLLNAEFHFTVDAAAKPENAKCRTFYTDALTHAWAGTVWLNPPYSKNAEFLKKAFEESQRGQTVVVLIPSRTDTKYWHDYVMRAAEIRFVKGRLRFGGLKAQAPFPSTIVVFKRCVYGPQVLTQVRE